MLKIVEGFVSEWSEVEWLVDGRRTPMVMAGAGADGVHLPTCWEAIKGLFDNHCRFASVAYDDHGKFVLFDFSMMAYNHRMRVLFWDSTEPFLGSSTG